MSTKYRIDAVWFEEPDKEQTLGFRDTAIVARDAAKNLFEANERLKQVRVTQVSEYEVTRFFRSDPLES